MTAAQVVLADLPQNLVESIADLLTSNGYSVRLASDPRAIEMLRAGYAIPALIVSAAGADTRREAKDHDLAVTRLLEPAMSPEALLKALAAA